MPSVPVFPSIFFPALGVFWIFIIWLLWKIFKSLKCAATSLKEIAASLKSKD